MDDLCVAPGKKVSLNKIDPDDVGEWKNQKEEGLVELEKLRQELDQLQELLYAEHKHKVLIVLQAMDTGGKDGTIRSVFEGINPQGVNVVSFKVPSTVEMDHDYLWRVHANVPGKGQLTVFNRSHYEDVLVVRVHNLVSSDVWKKRYEQINQFEQLLFSEGTLILKFFLHIDLDEQKQRLLERIETPEKRWKFNPGDLEERKLWPDYMEAYEDVLSLTSTEWAPWYVIPSNRNWYRNLSVAKIIVKKLKDLNMEYPPEVEDLEKYKTLI
jgi:PPK2 family polyphosphate:nucleotide phosphotransferase